MKPLIPSFMLILLLGSCNADINKATIQQEIIITEQAFETMAAQHGLATAFYFFAADSAVILRGSSLIKGRNNIQSFYQNDRFKNVILSWEPQFVEVSDCGTLAYTFGAYQMKSSNEEGEEIENHGYFHTVWKKQNDNSWKYVWD
ncbi:MAG: nuclear transport factor 2 family protein [Prolixibacteraceae bacterium]|nr:nuclear transport factor 2 family protein [Prolixibacteraceae bacterium]